MNDADIIKALECLRNGEILCKECAYKEIPYPACKALVAGHALNLINRQMKWISTKDRLPDKNGQYICYIEGSYLRCIKMCNFALNLEEVDEYDFVDKKHSGWYNYDGEYGYYEIDDVTYWMPCPEIPQEMTEGNNG